MKFEGKAVEFHCTDCRKVVLIQTVLVNENAMYLYGECKCGNTLTVSLFDLFKIMPVKALH